MLNILTSQQLNNLQIKYSESHRHYHNTMHILTMFQIATQYGITLSIPQIIAIFYHDAIYNPESTLNELDSVKFMEFELADSCHLKQDIINRASNIIFATKYHTSDIHEIQTVLDLDLAGLGFSWELYEDASKRIRQEYSHLSDDSWKNGRIVFLTSMLKRKQIFYTPWGLDCYENKARQNIEKELNGLNS